VAIVGGSDRRRQRTRLAVAGFILSLIISAHREEHADEPGAGAAETVVAELLGSFRQAVRLIFLIATAE
jgi:hypothetical protein